MRKSRLSIYSNIIRDEVKLKFYILSSYREVLIKLDSSSKQRAIVLRRFDKLKSKPDYYWLSQAKL